MVLALFQNQATTQTEAFFDLQTRGESWGRLSEFPETISRNLGSYRKLHSQSGTNQE